MQGLAFVGCEVITFNAVTSSGLQAEWLAALLQVKLQTLPGSQPVCHLACIPKFVVMFAWSSVAVELCQLDSQSRFDDPNHAVCWCEVCLWSVLIMWSAGQQHGRPGHD